jgi:hypothetical protein
MNDKIRYKIKSDNIWKENIEIFFKNNKSQVLQILKRSGKNKVGGVFNLEFNKIIELSSGDEDEIFFPFEVIWTKYLWESHPLNNNTSYFILTGNELNNVFKNFLGASIELGIKEQFHVVFSLAGVFGCRISIDEIPSFCNNSMNEYLELFSRVIKQYEMYNSYLMGENGFFNQNLNQINIYNEQVKLYKNIEYIDKLNKKINDVIKIVMEKFKNMKIDFFTVLFI